ncbi:DUF4041 domain-containing protein [Ligilactobacillus acidipiscis]|uniref:DUF4041 domain-containing protein n=1 Tax=Ligilactobacillus acidipiscis TaxID=89059 RepID=UPI0023F9BF22|nr:DUF4041 domain-containing protein [Ligilactobacillus acidipiscis]WEV57868.1 DUF4041 domain-containing protein [Ligilactobacillus acidipiscis]
MGLGDLFKVNDYKKKISELEDVNTELLQKNKLISDTKQATVVELEDMIKEKEKTLKELDKRYIDKLEQLKIDKLKDKRNSLKDDIRKLQGEIVTYQDIINVESFGLYQPRYNFDNSAIYKDKLAELRQHQKDLIKNDKAGIIVNAMTLDGSARKGKTMQKRNIKQLVRSFNTECEAAINKVTYSNFDRTEKRIDRSFKQLNNLNKSNGIILADAYLDAKKEELALVFEYSQKKQEEKDILREQREQEREEKKVQKEIEQQRKQVLKDTQHFENAKTELEEKIADAADEEKEVLLLKLKELEDKLKQLQAKESDLDYREGHATAGYVYIISNIGSFGQDVYKIGVTRRLEPMDRINELASASVPFKFDVHAMIFSENAYGLESELHERFKDQRVNKMNNRKEYYNITMDDIKQALEKYSDLTFDFDEEAEAYEYREGLRLAKAMQRQQNTNQVEAHSMEV